MIDIKNIRLSAENYYRNGDFYCSEAVVKSVLEGFGKEVNHELIAMSSGFPVGIGGAGCTCGAVSGGVMMVGYFFGRSQAGSGEVAKAMELSNELYKKFVANNKYTCCRALTRGMEKGSAEHMAQCVRFTGEIAEHVAELIAANTNEK